MAIVRAERPLEPARAAERGRRTRTLCVATHLAPSVMPLWHERWAAAIGS